MLVASEGCDEGWLEGARELKGPLLGTVNGSFDEIEEGYELTVGLELGCSDENSLGVSEGCDEGSLEGVWEVEGLPRGMIEVPMLELCWEMNS